MRITADIKKYGEVPSEGHVLAINNVFDPSVTGDTVSGCFRFCKTRLNDLCFCCINPDICNGSCLNITTRGEAVVFVFTNKETYCGNNSLFRQCKSCGKRFNLFYLSGENKFKINLNTVDRNNFPCIVLSTSFYKQITNGYPDLFEPGNRNKAQNSIVPLLGTGKYFSYEICRVIGQIQNCPLQGDAISLFMESKILELFAFLMELKFKNTGVQMQECVMGKIYKAKNILEEHYKKPPTIRELAIKVGTNETTLKRRFKELFNTTVYGYLLDYRMEKAKTLLCENKMSIQAISLKVGYEKQSNFATAFKRKFGVSPKEFLKMEV